MREKEIVRVKERDREREKYCVWVKKSERECVCMREIVRESM